MQVVATAGHVDHGKSTLLRALTGMEPDRWEEERRRGLTIDLGFVWARLGRPGDDVVAFVDVPGHERFVANMLAGVGPVTTVLFVVAADGGWMPQSAEHLAALDAFGVEHGVLAVTRSDLADPRPAMARAQDEIARTNLRDVPAVAVSATTGVGLPELTSALWEVLDRPPTPDPSSDVRLWVDRAFVVRGAGTVVTGTLAAGTVAVGDRLALTSTREPVAVRALQTLNQSVDRVVGPARIAVNLRGVDVSLVRRGDALLTPRAWLVTDVVDVRITRGDPDGLAREPVLHIGSAALGVRVRPLAGDVVRLRLDHPLPLRPGDRAALRDPGSRAVHGVVVLDPAPPSLRRRGAARRRAEQVAGQTGATSIGAEVRRRGVVRADTLRGLGLDPNEPADEVVTVGEWLVDGALAADLGARLRAAVDAHSADNPLEAGLPLEAARRQLGLPDRRLVSALVRPPLQVRAGRVYPRAGSAELPAAVTRALAALEADLAERPFAAPSAARLDELGLGPRELAAAERAGRLQRLAAGVVLPTSSVVAAGRTVGSLPQPFTVAEARTALATTRRVAVPLLELLDRRGVTRRLPDDRRQAVAVSRQPSPRRP